MSADGQGDPIDVLPPAAVATYERFVELLRAGDVDAARKLAPGVAIEEEGWPYEDETGPLNPDAFRVDPAYAREMYAEATAPEPRSARSRAASLGRVSAFSSAAPSARSSAVAPAYSAAQRSAGSSAAPAARARRRGTSS